MLPVKPVDGDEEGLSPSVMHRPLREAGALICGVAEALASL